MNNGWYHSRSRRGPSGWIPRWSRATFVKGNFPSSSIGNITAGSAEPPYATSALRISWLCPNSLTTKRLESVQTVKRPRSCAKARFTQTTLIKSIRISAHFRAWVGIRCWQQMEHQLQRTPAVLQIMLISNVHFHPPWANSNKNTYSRRKNNSKSADLRVLTI